MERPDTAVVILNKNNADGLERVLESLYRQSCPPCVCFDIYIVDGGSTDSSFSVASKAGLKIPCIYWLEQRVKGGTGPARIEIIETLRSIGYRYVIWGDSENIYSKDYVDRLLGLLEKGCDVASGRSVVIRGSIWAEMFYWYHSFHNLFPRLVGSKHAPGNNMAVKIGIYDLASYPPSKRSDDYIFTFQLLRRSGRGGSRPRYCIDEEAVVYIDMPRSFREVISWQRARVEGLVQGSIYIGLLIPPDLLSWSAPLALLILIMIIAIKDLNPLPLLLPLISSIALASYLQIKSQRHLDKASTISGFLGLIGMILHAIFTTSYSFKELVKIYLFIGSEELLEEMRKAEMLAKRVSMENLIPLGSRP
ncbi:MAG: glycosyltransferase family A protein [Sulfolobales archaeon]